MLSTEEDLLRGVIFTEESRHFVCVNATNLITPYPLEEYHLDDERCIVIKHAAVDSTV